MSTIRRQSIIASVIVYIGFAIGFLNTYLFTRQGGFTKEEYGLTGTFIAFANVLFSVAGLGMPVYIGKFFPYYKAHVPDRKNDQLTWALLVSTVGFAIVAVAGIVFKPFLIDKMFHKSPELLHYYYWVFPFAYGYTLYLVMEAYAWQQRKAVLSNFSKEVLFRCIVTFLIAGTTVGLLKSFDAFIHVYSFIYLFIAALLVVYFYRKKQFTITFTVSRVTRRFY